MYAQGTPIPLQFQLSRLVPGIISLFLNRAPLLRLTILCQADRVVKFCAAKPSFLWLPLSFLFSFTSLAKLCRFFIHVASTKLVNRHGIKLLLAAYYSLLAPTCTLKGFGRSPLVSSFSHQVPSCTMFRACTTPRLQWCTPSTVCYWSLLVSQTSLEGFCSFSHSQLSQTLLLPQVDPLWGPEDQ